LLQQKPPVLNCGCQLMQVVLYTTTTTTTTTTMVLWPFVRDYWVSWYQKKHSPTHHPDHHPIFISFFHLLQSIASFLFKLCAWQSFCTTSLHVLFGLPLGLEPSTSLWLSYEIGQAIIFLPCGFYLSSIYLFLFPRLISMAADRMSTILPHMV